MNKAMTYIFCINPGRAGSGYLYKLFNCAISMSAHHEPNPICNQKPMIDFLKGDESPMRKLIGEKVESIKSLKAGKRHYFESNHAFIKGFGWLIPSYLDKDEIGVIILERSPRKIAKSFRRIQCNSINHNGRGWLIHAPDKKRYVPLPFGDAFTILLYGVFRSYYKLHHGILKRINNFIKPGLNEKIHLIEMKLPKWFDIPLLTWYAEEVYQRGDIYRKTFPNITYYTISLQKLNSVEEIDKMFKHFGVEYSQEKVNEIVGLKVNQKSTFNTDGGVASP